MRFICWNSLSIVSAYRSLESSDVFPNCSIAMLAGTGVKDFEETQSVTTSNAGNAGRRLTSRSPNRSAGVAVTLHHDFEESVRD